MNWAMTHKYAMASVMLITLGLEPWGVQAKIGQTPPTVEESATMDSTARAELPVPAAPPAPITEKRTIQLRWKFDPEVDTRQLVMGIWRSLDGGPYMEIGRTLSGALNFSYVTEELNKQHCYYAVAIIGPDVGPQSEPYCENIHPVPKPLDLRRVEQ
jgi:hypothetical protein